MRRHPNVVGEAELPAAEFSRGEKYGERRQQLAMAAGGQKLGCSLYEIPPGRTAWPRHFHLANEEAIYVLSGTGTLTLGEAQIAVGAGDYAALPVGEAHAHQLVNTGEEPLRYLCLSTMLEPDVTVYPDSNKLGVFAGAAPGGPRVKRTFAAFLDNSARVDFWQDE